MKWIPHFPGVNTPAVGSVVYVRTDGFAGPSESGPVRVSFLGTSIGSWRETSNTGRYVRVTHFAYLTEAKPNADRKQADRQQLELVDALPTPANGGSE